MPMLYEDINTAFRFLPKPLMPTYLSDNLKHNFRDYQKEALENFIFYMTNQNYQNIKPKHLLFHMATGSGKTNLIASSILYLYAQGYRNFVFFVNTTNIILKTKDNLLNKYSQKYLFQESIVIDSKIVNINEINGTFADSKADDINIYFTTVQGLHTNLTTLKENSITYSDFEDKKLVLIADEAHHLNANKTSKNKAEKEEATSWGDTVEKLLKINPENILLEFTATADLNNQAIAIHYNNKIIYDYPLKKFRDAKYSKDIILQSDDFAPCGDLVDKQLRMLQAILISQYRKIIAERYHIALKPVVMFKNRATNDADANYQLFQQMIDNLDTKHLECLFNRDHPILNSTKAIYSNNLQDLIMAIKRDFSNDKCVVIYGTQQDREETLKNLNNLENPSNNIRAIFAVDMLNEGWDVLNLFDVVKLDEAPTASNNTTTKEAQLIGRGARYYPFSVNDDEKYKRKFDEDLGNELRILEEMYFYSVNKNVYIGILKQELTRSGIADFSQQTADKIVEMKVKQSFLTCDFYKNGAILVNKRVPNDKTNKTSIQDYWVDFNNEPFKWQHIDTSSSQVAMGNNEVNSDVAFNTSQYKLTDISECVVRSAINRNDFFCFANLKKYFPNLKSISSFIADKNFLGDIKWQVSHTGNFIPIWQEQRKMVESVLEIIQKEIVKNSYEYEGSKEFCPLPIKDRIIDKKLKVNHSNTSMNRLNPPFNLNPNPDSKEWYVYDENFGTSEEQAFVKFFDTQYQTLTTKYSDIWLIRNEKAYWIYSFNNNGQRFEPDFILLLKCNTSNCRYQIFIEPKGDHLLLLDQWKEEFLKQIANAVKCTSDKAKLIEDKCFKIIGLPFYNYSKQCDFAESFNKILRLCIDT